MPERKPCVAVSETREEFAYVCGHGDWPKKPAAFSAFGELYEEHEQHRRMTGCSGKLLSIR